ncbi:MAG TPA: hypothetical protein VES65_09915 [Solirubrobacteraceae bacterium]|nr:hypothetical protein [Solirubrobacteraceae bacterium]
MDFLEPATERLWKTIGKVAEALESETGWCLIGGLMVQLFAHEAGQSARPTNDIDILADARSRPSRTEMLASKLQSLGGDAMDPSGLDRQDGYQFELDGEVVEILAPDGLSQRTPARTVGNLETIQVPGGTQALQRSEEVEVVIGAQDAFRLRRPTLLGAILLKARSLEVHRRPEDQRSDLILLLSLLDDPRAARNQLQGQEQEWLQRIAARIDFPDPALRGSFTATQLTRAEDAYALLAI